MTEEKTNYDRFVCKSPKELVEMWAKCCPPDRKRDGDECSSFISCKDCLLDWLKQPVEEETE